MSAKKPAAPKKSGPPKKKKGFKAGPHLKVAGILLLLILIGGGYLVARNYHLQSVREGLENIVGELDQENVVLRAADPQSAQALSSKIKSLAESSWGALSVTGPTSGKSSLTLDAALGGKSYRIEIRWEGSALPKPEPKAERPTQKTEAPRQGAKMAIVIDDMGADLKLASALFELPYEITPAILPYLQHSTELAKMSFAINRPYLLHMPMEPKNTGKANPGKGAIFHGDGPDKVKEKLDAALNSVPGVSGVNNHMGSRATEDSAVMASVMADLEHRGLFFLDSGTSPASVGAKTASRSGLKWAKRDVFLDNVADQAAILAKLEETLSLAKKTGLAIAIGHGRPETLKALQAWGKTAAEQGVKIVPVTEVLHDKTLETN